MSTAADSASHFGTFVVAACREKPGCLAKSPGHRVLLRLISHIRCRESAESRGDHTLSIQRTTLPAAAALAAVSFIVLRSMY